MDILRPLGFLFTKIFDVADEFFGCRGTGFHAGDGHDDCSAEWRVDGQGDDVFSASFQYQLMLNPLPLAVQLRTVPIRIMCLRFLL